MQAVQPNPGLRVVGMGIALVSIAIFFLALIVAYAVALGGQSLKSIRIPGVLWLSTALLPTSSVALEAGRSALRRGLVAHYRTRLLASLALGIAFLVCQVFSWAQLLLQGVHLAGNLPGSVFYLFTGAHSVHVAGGLFFLGYLFQRSRILLAGTEQDLRRHRRVVQTGAMYWHFMGVLWTVLFTLLFWWTRQ